MIGNWFSDVEVIFQVHNACCHRVKEILNFSSGKASKINDMASEESKCKSIWKCGGNLKKMTHEKLYLPKIDWHLRNLETLSERILL